MADEPQRHRIEVACPECQHRQVEPALVVSTQCRACRTNYQVRDGKGVVKPDTTRRVTAPRREPIPEPEPAPVMTQELLRAGRSSSTPARSFFMRLIYPQKPPREIICFECNHEFSAIAEAQSSQCSKCGAYVNLLDHNITEPWNRRIQTRGNVIIQKTGSVSGATIRCHDLTVLGELAGSAECSGNLIIRSHGKIIGNIQCRNLRVEKGARVEFLNPVTAVNASIDGNVRGQISCTGTITLEKRAHLHGLVRTSSLVVKPGAKHTGTIEMITSSPT